MCAVFKRERAFTGPRHVEGPAPDVHWVEEERDWSVEASCERCGGYRMLLQVRDPGHLRLAESRADAFLTRIHARGGCLGCEARSWRNRGGPTTGEPPGLGGTDTRQWEARAGAAGLGPHPPRP